MNPATPDTPAVAQKRANLALLFACHRAKLNEIIAIAERHPDKPVLRELAREARGALAGIKITEADPYLTGTHGSFGEWGPNGRQPRIDGMHRDALFHEARAKAAVNGALVLRNAA